MAQSLQSIKLRFIKKLESNGLNIHSSALEKIVQFISEQIIDKENCEENLMKVILRLNKSFGPITELLATDVIKQLENQSSNSKKLNFKIIDAFSMDRIIYDNDKNKFILMPTNTKKIIGDSEDALNFYHFRYKLIYECLKRNPIFSTNSDNKLKLWSISEIKHDRTDTKKITFGLLGLDSNGKYKLEDPNSSISLDLLRAVYASQLISLDSFVLVEGHHDAGMFIVQTIGNPPIPSRDSYINTCILESSNESYSLNMNVTNERVKIVIFSDVWLDKPDVIKSISTHFEKFSQSSKPPFLFILCGNFISQENINNFSILKDGLKNISRVIERFPSLKQSKFIIVPGPNDPGLNSFIPRDALPKSITDDIENLIFCSNPVRIKIQNKQILIYRDEIFERIGKSSLQCPIDAAVLPKEYVSAALSQAHLCPIPFYSRPLLWHHENCLSIYPLPDLIITAINYPKFVVKEMCTFANPGCYSINQYEYLEYDLKIN